MLNVCVRWNNTLTETTTTWSHEHVHAQTKSTVQRRNWTLQWARIGSGPVFFTWYKRYFWRSWIYIGIKIDISKEIAFFVQNNDDFLAHQNIQRSLICPTMRQKLWCFYIHPNKITQYVIFCCFYSVTSCIQFNQVKRRALKSSVSESSSGHNTYKHNK